MRHWLPDAARTLLDHSPALVFVMDTEHRLVYVNRAYVQRTGKSERELIGLTAADLLPPEAAAAVLARERRVLEELQPAQVESSFLEPDGILHTWFTVKFPLTDEHGTVVGIGGIATDITERKRDEAALKSSQERFEKVFRASTLSISAVRRADDRFVEINPACEKLTGWRRDEMLGRTATELGLWARPDDRARAHEILTREGRVSGFRTGLRMRDGTIHEALMSLELIELGGQPCVLALAHDITDMARLQQRLEQTQRLEALGRLAGGVAHDFNNLLTAIQGYAELVVAEAPAGSRLRSYIEHVQRAAQRAAALTAQLLVFGRQQVRPANAVDVNATITGLVAMLTRLIGEDVRLETALAADVPAAAVDAAQLEQVVLNLALNARDAMPGGGRLCIATSAGRDDADARTVTLSVSDDGIGMDEATRARIFEPFFTTKEVGKGTGLGLATVYGIVEQAGGRIGVTSEPGKGARFDVVLPAALRERVAASEPPMAIAPGASRKETLLVVEDDESVREFVCLVLREAHYDVFHAGDGEAALAVAAERRGHVDLLVTDIVMPNRNGRSLANVLRHAVPELRVMYMSGYPGDTIERYDDIPPGDTFLQKPFTREALLAAVGHALRR